MLRGITPPRARRAAAEQALSSQFDVPNLLGAVVDLISEGVDGDGERLPIEMVPPSIRRHRFPQGGPLGVRGPVLAGSIRMKHDIVRRTTVPTLIE